jgi:hypothetical protein
LSKPKLPTYHGRSIGIVALTGAQLLIGSIHVFFGLLLLAFENIALLQVTVTYDVYTIVFGAFTVLFAVFIWRGKRIGWIGTIAVSVFVIAADSLTLLNLPSIPGIPKFAGGAEIAYSVVIVAYLLSTWKRLTAPHIELS